MTTPTPYNYRAVQAANPPLGLSGGVTLSDETASTSGPETNSYRWAAVTQLSPLRIKLDGESLALPITPESLVASTALRVGTRVWVQLYGRRVVILGASQAGADILVPIGGIIEWPGSTVPNSNWAFANGQALSRTTYAALFAVCGTTYGAGDGSTTFNLPNYTDRVPVGSGGVYARGATGGAATVTLATANMPGHSHTYSGSATTDSGGSHFHDLSGGTSNNGDHWHTGDGGSGGRNDLCAGCGSSAAQDGTGATSTNGAHSHSLTGGTTTNGSHGHNVNFGGTTASAGSGTAFSTMPPYLAVPFIIRVL